LAVYPGTAARLHQGDGERLAGGAGGRGLGAVSINVRITAVRKLAVEAADNGLLAPELANGITRVKGVASKGVRLGNWLSVRQAQTLLNTLTSPPQGPARPRHPRGAARLRVTALRGGGADDGAYPATGRSLVHRGSPRKARRVRTIPMPTWVKVAIDAWTAAAGVGDGPVFRSMNRGDQAQAAALSEKVVWQLLQPYAVAGACRNCTHDCRRTCAKLCALPAGVGADPIATGTLQCRRPNATWARSRIS